MRRNGVNKIVAAICGLLVFGVVIFLTLEYVSFFEEREQQRERVEVMQRFVNFHTEAEITINESMALLEGYLAFIETNSDMTEEESIEFLDRLLEDKQTIIKNIGIIKDTTIIWNYPREGNEKAIGTDLSRIDGQRDDVLNVKRGKDSVFVGPIDLIQGGKGFIVRIPIFRDGNYWGQTSIVLDAYKYLDLVTESARKQNLDITVFNMDDYPDNPIYGKASILEGNPLELPMEIMDSNWVIATVPVGGWNWTKGILWEIRIISFTVAFLIGALVFAFVYSASLLRHKAKYDQLTKTLNRHSLDESIKNINKRIQENGVEVIVAVFDINDFKMINDSYGHEIGDRVLQMFSEKLIKFTGSNGKIFRTGGDEFLHLHIVEKRIDKDFYGEYKNITFFRFNSGSVEFDVISSVGISSCPHDSIYVEEAIAIADKRMYEDKEGIKARKYKKLLEGR